MTQSSIVRYSPAWMSAVGWDLAHDTDWQRRSGALSADVFFEFGGAGYLLRFRDGDLIDIKAGLQFTQPWNFALRASAAAWNDLLCAVPAPQKHSVFGLMKSGDLKLEGDIKLFMQHIWGMLRMIEVMRAVSGAS